MVFGTILVGKQLAKTQKVHEVYEILENIEPI